MYTLFKKFFKKKINILQVVPFLQLAEKINHNKQDIYLYNNKYLTDLDPSFLKKPKEITNLPIYYAENQIISYKAAIKAPKYNNNDVDNSTLSERKAIAQSKLDALESNFLNVFDIVLKLDTSPFLNKNNLALYKDYKIVDVTNFVQNHEYFI